MTDVGRLRDELTVLRGDIEVKHEEIRAANAELVRMMKRRDELLCQLAQKNQAEIVGAMD
jgi:hypothetical protein